MTGADPVEAPTTSVDAVARLAPGYIAAGKSRLHRLGRAAKMAANLSSAVAIDTTLGLLRLPKTRALVAQVAVKVGQHLEDGQLPSQEDTEAMVASMMTPEVFEELLGRFGIEGPAEMPAEMLASVRERYAPLAN